MENAPIAISNRKIMTIRSGINYLATGPVQFAPGVQPLIGLHTKEGLRGTYVDQEQIFDYYYGFGRYGPAPIQTAVRASKPQYLLLLGRTTYDYHNYSGANVDPLCPAFLVSRSFWAQATSDALFGDLGRGIPEVAVGRLPVNNTTELSGAVNRVFSTIEGLPRPLVQSPGLTADTIDPASGDFPRQSDSLAAALPDFAWQRNYQRNYLGITAQTFGDATSAITTAANGAADLLIYVGHGNAIGLGNATPKILDTTSVQNWHGHLPLLQCTCTANWMAKDVQNYHSIAIQALTQPQGGICASIGTSTYMNSACDVAFMGQLVKNARPARHALG